MACWSIDSLSDNPPMSRGEDGILKQLPVPEVVRCYFDDSLDIHLPAMSLRWPISSEDSMHTWSFPEGVLIRTGLPTHFGINIQRLARDTYTVQMLWNRLHLFWPSLARNELVQGDLGAILAAIGTDLWYLLDQPIDHSVFMTPRAA